MKKSPDWITAKTAQDVLRVKPQTLYAYVSRGLLRAKQDPNDYRRSLYSRHDADTLLQRKKSPRRRADVAAGAISWGEPVLNSSISAVQDGRLVFGDALATELSKTARLEDVAKHHWRGPAVEPARAPTPIPKAATPKLRGFSYLAHLAGSAPVSMGRTREALCVESWDILSGFANALIGKYQKGAIHERLGGIWKLDAAGTDHVRRALVLLSDHELNASTFAVRVAASTGAALGAAALAGYATLTGPLHGESSSMALRVLRESMESGSPEESLQQAMAGGEIEYGYGHNLYPDGDVRAADLLQAIAPSGKIMAIIHRCEEITGHKANIDAALAVLAMSYQLPRDSMFMIFAISRMSGWLAHAIEQQETGQLIRPRAQFVPPSHEAK